MYSKAGPHDRIESLALVKPIVYGSISRQLEPTNEINAHTHQWTLYLRPYYNEDMSRYVKKVVFKLHDSFVNNNRCLNEPPYEVTETGWGEFEATIKISFHCPNEKPIILKHYLRLFPKCELGGLIDNKPLVSEFYDEIIFHSPTRSLAEILLHNELECLPLQHAKNYEDEKAATQKAILEAHERIRKEISSVRYKLSAAATEIRKIKKLIHLESMIHL